MGLGRDEIKKIIENDILYARPLAFNDDGAELLKRIRKIDFPSGSFTPL